MEEKSKLKLPKDSPQLNYICKGESVFVCVCVSVSELVRRSSSS
jgi:hypothetical protein